MISYTINYDLTLFYMISKASVNSGERHRLFRASSLLCYIDIGRCGMSDNETTLYPSHNL